MNTNTIPILVITLDRRPDRFAKTLQRAAAANIDPERIVRISAVDATSFDVTQHPSVSILTAYNIKFGERRSHYEIDRPGAVGASLSHFKAWEYLQKSLVDEIIVFEDDTTIPLDFNERVATMAADLPPAWDVVTFYNTPIADGTKGCKESDELPAPWHICHALVGAHAYMISRRGASRLLARAYPIELHVDAYMVFMTRLGLVTLMWHPALDIPQDGADSDINHGDLGLLNIPTNMHGEGFVAMDTTGIVGIVAMVAVAGALVSIAFAPRPR